MDKEKLPPGYQDWIETEKRESQEAYLKYLKQKPQFQVPSLQFSVFRNTMTRIVAAAVVVVVLSVSIWISRDKIFNTAPKYTEEQIALSYQHTIKALTAYSSSLNKGFDKIQSLPSKITNDDTP